MELFLLMLLGATFPLLVGIAVYKALLTKGPRGERLEIDEAALASAEKSLREEGERDWVVVKRCHGPGYSHTAMAEIVGALTAEGIEATYDVIGTSSADGGVTNYMLKVIAEDEERAREVLAKMDEPP